jgi:hypothetical protein
MIQAELKRLHSPDVLDLENWTPDLADDFSFLLQAMIGPKNGPGEESFDIVVCTPDWLKRNKGARPLIGEHHLIVSQYNFRALRDFISEFVGDCTGKDWSEVARKLGHLGRWEFEDYRASAK